MLFFDENTCFLKRKPTGTLVQIWEVNKNGFRRVFNIFPSFLIDDSAISVQWKRHIFDYLEMKTTFNTSYIVSFTSRVLHYNYSARNRKCYHGQIPPLQNLCSWIGVLLLKNTTRVDSYSNRLKPLSRSFRSTQGGAFGALAIARWGAPSAVISDIF